MKIKLYALLLLVTVVMFGCKDEYDDTNIRTQISEVTDQVKTLQTLTEALQNRDYITSITPTTVEGTSGYTITFAKADPITILNGSSTISGVDTSNENYVIFTMNDGTTITVPRSSGIFIAFESYDTFYCSPTDNEITLVLPPTLKESDYYSIVATVSNGSGTDMDIQTRSTSTDDKWGVKITKPTFTNGVLDTGSAKVTLTLPQNKTNYKALLRVTIIDKNGKEFSINRIVWFKADNDVNVIDNTTGDLSSKITEPQSIKQLSLVGNLSDNDLKYIRENLTSMEVLDLSRATITELPEKAMAFYGSMGLTDNTSLTTVILPETLTTIGNSVFAMCKNLQEINIPANVRTLGRWMFEGCNRLAEVTLPDGITELPASAFYDTGIKSIELPASITTIGGWAFKQCNNLTSMTIPASVTSLGKGIFENCSTLSSADIKANISILPGDIFLNCVKLTDLKLSSTITEFEGNNFAGTGFTEFVIPSRITKIGQGAFSCCNNLKSVTLPANLQMSFSLFAYCPNLENVTIAEGITEIGAETFRDCTSLTAIVLPSTITSIRDRAFQGCSALVSFTCKAATAPELSPHNTGENYNLHFYGINASCVLKRPNGANYSAWSAKFGGGTQDL